FHLSWEAAPGNDADPSIPGNGLLQVSQLVGRKSQTGSKRITSRTMYCVFPYTSLGGERPEVSSRNWFYNENIVEPNHRG
ncbi:MAG: hypothetical protein P4L43_09695, partial [Syntrophobacteraceae bacterium]|nr:hypothetical protein [Syntrophobacteraceae bacterium]